jgi:transglutaminase-like putative cysteine protease
MNRRTAATVVLLTWFGALGWLVQRHYLGAPRASDTPRWPVPPGSAFHAIRLGSRQYGLASLTVDTLPEGLRVIELTTLDLPSIRNSVPRRTSTRTEALYSRALQLRSWSSAVLTEQGRTASTGSISGDTLLTVTGGGNGEVPETLTVALRRPVVLPSAIPLVAASRGLPRTGTKLNVEVYDPLDQELRSERISIAAESLFTVPDSAEFNEPIRRWTVAHADTVRAWRLERFEHGLPVLQWIDAAGMTVRVQHGLGASLDRSAFELVNSNFRALPTPVWDTSASAPSYLLVDGPPEPARRMVVLARLAPPMPLPALLPALEGGWQSRRGETLEVAPVSGTDSAPDAAVIAEPLLAGDDPGLARAAALVAGRERQPERVAQALEDWVRRTITLREGSGSWSAGRAFRRRSGTAIERVRVLVAMARSAGMEARPVTGLVRVDGRWQLREWAELWTGNWTPLDPALPGGTPLAARIRLLTGGNARQLDLALRAGRLSLDVLEETR